MGWTYLIYGVGVAVYALRVPERFGLGKFDYVGALAYLQFGSHALWHIIMLAGIVTLMYAIVTFSHWRYETQCIIPERGL